MDPGENPGQFPAEPGDGSAQYERNREFDQAQFSLPEGGQRHQDGGDQREGSEQGISSQQDEGGEHRRVAPPQETLPVHQDQAGGDGVAQHLGEQEPVGLEQVDGVVQPRDEQQQEQGGQGGEPGGFPFQAERFPGKPGLQAQAQGKQGCPEHGEMAELRQEGADERQDAPGLFKEGAQVFPLRAEEGILL